MKLCIKLYQRAVLFPFSPNQKKKRKEKKKKFKRYSTINVTKNFLILKKEIRVLKRMECFCLTPFLTHCVRVC